MLRPPDISDWDGQLSPHILKSEKIWWDVFPPIKPRLPSKLVRLLGGPRQAPPPEAVGKVMLVADTKAELEHWLPSLGVFARDLLNHWGCYCQSMNTAGQWAYAAGAATKPSFMFELDWQTLGLLATASLAAVATIDSSIDADTAQGVMRMWERDRQGWPETIEVPVLQFDPGEWQNGLDIAFKAAIWLASNRNEALARIWKIQV